MFDVKVGDILLCNKDSPWAARVRKGDLVKVVSVNFKNDEYASFSYYKLGSYQDNLAWSGNTRYNWFEPFSEDLENK